MRDHKISKSIRGNNSVVISLKFCEISFASLSYIVYIDAIEYSGYRLRNIILRLLSRAITNTTYPKYGMYKAITATNGNSNIKQ